MPIPSQDTSTITEGAIYFKIHNRSSSPVKMVPSNILLHKIFGLDNNEKAQKSVTANESTCKTSKRSPRILITRAFSEESDKSSNPNTPHREISKVRSTSATTLLEKKWRHLRYKVSRHDDQH